MSIRLKLINTLKQNPGLCNTAWWLARAGLNCMKIFVPIKPKTILFSSFGGRKFDDSPRAIYEKICNSEEFDDWKIIWAFVDIEPFEIPRGEKVKIDTLSFFKTLLTSQVWVSNTVMDRGIQLHRNGVIKIETWHGTPLKKIGGEEHPNSQAAKKKSPGEKGVIRCAQSEYDRKIFSRIFDVPEEDFLMSDLPRNDSLKNYSDKMCKDIKLSLGIDERKVILYTPTFREFLVNEENEYTLAPPMDLAKWESHLSEKYVLLIRAHYAVSAALNIPNSDFVKDVSSYPCLNDLYAIADLMISDYSSCYFDYSILDRPMLCFAYDLEEYEQKRGLYLNLEENLPCPIDTTEDQVIQHIQLMDFKEYSQRTQLFHKRFAPYAGDATCCVVNELKKKLNLTLQ